MHMGFDNATVYHLARHSQIRNFKLDPMSGHLLPGPRPGGLGASPRGGGISQKDPSVCSVTNYYKNYKKSIDVAIDIPPHREKRTLNFDEWYITKGDSDMDRIKL